MDQPGMNSVAPQQPSDTPYFWRDNALPFIEARSIEDGRKVCYSRHSHEFFSIGAITHGHSTYLHEKSRQRIDTGTVVLMNPGDVHACNPIDDQPWSYVMFYVDSHWLTALQHDVGLDRNNGFTPLAATHSQDPGLFLGLNQLFATLADPQADTLHKHTTALRFFTAMQDSLGATRQRPGKLPSRIERAAEYIDDNFRAPIKLEDICAAASLSPSYLIRSFEARYHMTPHAYLINRRIQHGREQLRQGRLIADIALETGFADQAHFQRVFKKHLAATPGQYRP
jgi:AraC-like DNA-binding protein